jgi:hypothetical protein
MSRVAVKRIRQVNAQVADPETGERMTKKREIEIDPREVEMRSFVSELSRTYAAQIDYYETFGNCSPEQARTEAAAAREHNREGVKGIPARKGSWHHLSAVGATNMSAALELWEKIRDEARDSVEHGEMWTQVFVEQTSPFERAQIFALREQMADGWTPQNGIESALLDMLTGSYLLHLHWTGIAHEWAPRTVINLEKDKRKSPYRSEQKWTPLYISAGECVDRASRLADGYHRQFMRALRQLRDLRRYAPPVIINQGGQVNVANQQMNVNKG